MVGHKNESVYLGSEFQCQSSPFACKNSDPKSCKNLFPLCQSGRRTAQAESDGGIKVMIAAGYSRIADRVAEIHRCARRGFDSYHRRKVSSRMFSRNPIRADAEFGIHRLLEPELSAGSLRLRRKNIFARVIGAGCQPRIRFETFTDLQIDIISDVIRPVSNRNVNVIAPN